MSLHFCVHLCTCMHEPVFPTQGLHCSFTQTAVSLRSLTYSFASGKASTGSDFFLLGLCLGTFSFLLLSLSFASYLSTARLSSSILALLLALAVVRNGHLLQALLSLCVPGKLLLWAHAVLAALVLLALLLAVCFIKFFLICPVQPSIKSRD